MNSLLSKQFYAKLLTIKLGPIPPHEEDLLHTIKNVALYVSDQWSYCLF